MRAGSYNFFQFLPPPNVDIIEIKYVFEETNNVPLIANSTPFLTLMDDQLAFAGIFVDGDIAFTKRLEDEVKCTDK